MSADTYVVVMVDPVAKECLPKARFNVEWLFQFHYLFTIATLNAPKTWTVVVVVVDS